MPRFAANLSMTFNEVDFLDRFAAARAQGFSAVEYLFPYAYPKTELAARLEGRGPAAGAVQCATGQLGGRRARHCRLAGPRRRIPPGDGNRARLCHGAEMPAHPCHGGVGARRRDRPASIAQTFSAICAGRAARQQAGVQLTARGAEPDRLSRLSGGQCRDGPATSSRRSAATTSSCNTISIMPDDAGPVGRHHARDASA